MSEPPTPIIYFTPPLQKSLEVRRDQRHVTILLVGRLIQNGATELCRIRNISTWGLRADTVSPLPRGTRLVIEPKTGQTLVGTVVWCNDFTIGVRFDTELDVDNFLSNRAVLDDGLRARMPRVALICSARIRAAAHFHHVEVRDLSQGGVKVKIETNIDEGENVTVTLDGLRTLDGIVRWCRGGFAGISYNGVVPFSELVDWMRARSQPNVEPGPGI